MIPVSATIKSAINNKMQSDHLPYLDGWRGLAVTLVLFGHFIYIGNLGLAEMGVELFFVLSGRLMAEILFIRNMSLVRFFKKRIARIIPALYVFVIAMLLASSILSGTIKRQHSTKLLDITDALSAFTFTLNYYHAINKFSSVLDHVWSLCVEEHAYLVLGFLAFIFKRHSHVRWVLIIFCLLCFSNGLVRSFVTPAGEHDIYWRTDVRIASIFAGAAGFLFLVKLKSSSYFTWLWMTALLLGLALLTELFPPYIKYTLGTSLLAFCMSTLRIAPNFILNWLSVKPLQIIGKYSFSIYLWQEPFYKFSFQKPLLSLGLLPIAIATGLISFHFIESPLRKWLNKVWV
jgi:peptidoglycan/LPS O-acetylase OafA/YrhL